MHDVVFSFGHKAYKRNIPANWNELSQDQFTYIARSIEASGDTLTLDDKIEILRYLLNIPDKVLAAIGEDDYGQDNKIMLNYFKYLGSGEKIKKLLDLLSYMDDVPQYGWQIIKKAGKLTGPEDGFRNVRFGEFVFADTYYLRFRKEHHYADLDKMIVSLFRPRDRSIKVSSPQYNGDVREKFNEHVIERRAERLKLSRDLKIAILLNYSFTRIWIEKQYPVLFPARSGMQMDENTGINYKIWVNTIRSLRRTRPGIENELLLNVLADLEDDLKTSS